MNLLLIFLCSATRHCTTLVLRLVWSFRSSDLRITEFLSMRLSGQLHCLEFKYQINCQHLFLTIPPLYWIEIKSSCGLSCSLSSCMERGYSSRPQRPHAMSRRSIGTIILLTSRCEQNRIVCQSVVQTEIVSVLHRYSPLTPDPGQWSSVRKLCLRFVGRFVS
jgi:hypothetical protein